MSLVTTLHYLTLNQRSSGGYSRYRGRLAMMVLDWCDEADAVISDLTRDGSGVDFAVFTVQDPKSKSPRLVFRDFTLDKGQGGREGVQKVLEKAADDSILIGCFLVSAIDQEDGSSAVSVRSKFIHVIWMGDSVGVMLRGKINGWASEVRKKFPQANLSLTLNGSDFDDLQPSSLESSLSSAGGAHKPKRYSFTNSTIMGRDAAAAAKAAEEAKRKAEEEARRKAEEDRLRAEEARRKAEEAKKKAEEEAHLKAEEEERKKLEEEARKRAEEERKKAEEEARKRAEEEAKQKAAEEAKRKLEEEERRRKAEERRRREEAERQRTKIRITENASLGDGRKLVLLVSKLSGNFQQSSNTSRLKVIIDGLGLPAEEIDEVDGSDEEQRERRNALFDLSGRRAEYPQVFLMEVDHNYTFVGDFDAIQYLNETGTVAETLGIIVKQRKTTQTVRDEDGVEKVIEETTEDVA